MRDHATPFGFGDFLGCVEGGCAGAMSSPEAAGHRSCRVEADRGRLRPGVDRHTRRCRDARSDPRQLRVSSNADPDQPPLGARLGLLPSELCVPDSRTRARRMSGPRQQKLQSRGAVTSERRISGHGSGLRDLYGAFPVK
jgi:hypothetical protein